MKDLKLISSKNELFIFGVIIMFIFLFNLISQYMKYKDFTKEEIFYSKFKIMNIYEKEYFYVLKLQKNDLVLFSSIDKENKIDKLYDINLATLTTNVSFLDFLKGFYAKSIYYDNIKFDSNFKSSLFLNINSQHKDSKLQELFNALFLAIPISKENKEIYNNFSITHLIAISGFHLGILSFISYWILYFPYSFLHKRYFIFRNKNADIIMISMFFLFFYLLLSNIVPSLLRSYIMLFLGFLFLRSSIKILSFETLAITFLLIISFFPKLIFSISFWFSIIGVFYIFLYIHYFKNLPKIFSFLFFNIWIFFVFNPIVHFFFYNTTHEQLLSPIITLIFTLFYPFELILHMINLGNLLDKYLIEFVNYEMDVFYVSTPFWFFLLFTIFSFSSIFDKKSFILLNVLMIIFNLYLYI